MAQAQAPHPRLFGIVARDVDVVAVIRRGPTDWCHVSRWDVLANDVQAGSWLRGVIAPQKCDLSPDGTWFLYSAVKHPGDWEGGAVYEAISRLPWLTALTAWEAGTTYTRGAHFVDDAARNELGEPSVGSPDVSGYGLAVTAPIQFAVERRRGWIETADTAERDTGGPWDEDRAVSMTRRQPGGELVLKVSGAFAAFRSIPSHHHGVEYTLVWPTGEVALDDVQWADWSADGQLLTATTAGELVAHRTINDDEMIETQRHDLAAQQPDPQPPPPEARTA